MGIGQLAVVALIAAVVAGGTGAAVADLASTDDPGVGAIDLRKDDGAPGDELVEDEEDPDGDGTKGADGTKGGNDTGRDGDDTRGNDGTGGGDNTVAQAGGGGYAPAPAYGGGGGGGSVSGGGSNT